MKRIVLAAVLLLAACTPEQLNQAGAYQQQIAGVCNVAMMLAPMAGPVAPWIVGGCGTEAAVAKLALEPSSLQWISEIVAERKVIRE